MAKIFSGMRPSGKLHLGNYLGAIRNWIALQDAPDTEQCVFSVVDLHGITTPYNPKTYPQQVRDVILDYLAAGIDPEKSLLVRQSRIPQHTQLMWLLSTITPLGWLERLPNWREKTGQIETMGDSGTSYQNNLSLLSYPVLMAADILLYKSDLVPVGEDQRIHIEITNEIGSKFNALFPGQTGGDIFPNVKPHIAEGARIMSLQNPASKMSKTPSTGSGQAADSYIALTDDADTIRAKFKRAVTDSDTEIKFDEIEKPAISNLLTIYRLLSAKSIGEMEKEYAGKGYSAFKADLAEIVIGFLVPLQERRAHYAADPAAVEKILTNSENKAKSIAEETLTIVRERMGLF
jgi:tryptophanyl-tRNA synthetase